ncbi:MAG: NAD(P)H-binding protein [Microbacterium sp.]
MSRIIVLGGTGYAGSAIVAEAADRGHEVVSYSRSLPESQLPGVTYVRGDVTDTAELAKVVGGSDAVVGALAPRGALAATFRDAYASIAQVADEANVPLHIVGGYSSLRPASDAPRFVTDLSHAPAEYHAELTTVSALVSDDLPATPESLDWVFVSPAGRFGAHAPGKRLGRYRVGDDVALHPEDGGEISGADYAIGFVDLIEQGDHHRAHLNLAY